MSKLRREKKIKGVDRWRVEGSRFTPVKCIGGRLFSMVSTKDEVFNDPTKTPVGTQDSGILEPVLSNKVVDDEFGFS